MEALLGIQTLEKVEKLEKMVKALTSRKVENQTILRRMIQLTRMSCEDVVNGLNWSILPIMRNATSKA